MRGNGSLLSFGVFKRPRWQDTLIQSVLVFDVALVVHPIANDEGFQLEQRLVS
jgi:hypothetical protein